MGNGGKRPVPDSLADHRQNNRRASVFTNLANTIQHNIHLPRQFIVRATNEYTVRRGSGVGSIGWAEHFEQKIPSLRAAMMTRGKGNARINDRE